jgi:hypothetical protein
MFTGELHFDAARASYSFDERYLHLPLQRDEPALRTMLKRALPLTVLQYRRDRLLGERVRELLRLRPAEAATADAIAAPAPHVEPHAAPAIAGRRRAAAGLEGRGAASPGRRPVAAHRAGRSSRSRWPWAFATRRAFHAPSANGPARPPANSGREGR